MASNGLELLRQADVSLARVSKPVSSEPSGATPAMAANVESTVLSNTSTAQGQDSFFVGLKRDIVRLIGNLAYRSRHVQDRIRNCNGLIVMLSQCNIDDANPCKSSIWMFLCEDGCVELRQVCDGYSID